LTIADESAQRRWRTSRYVSPLLLIACVLAGAKFIVRGPMRSGSNSGDFRAIYMPSRAWTHGLDPYNYSVLLQQWREGGGSIQDAPSHFTSPSIYPPTALLLMSPFARLPWRYAWRVWCGVNLAALALLLICVHRLSGFVWLETPSLCLIAGTLALEPISTTMMLGQTAIVVVAIGSLSLLSGLRGAETSNGLLAGVALALKPQLAAAFPAPYVLARRWRACAFTAIAMVAIAAFSVWRLNAQHAWFANYLDNLRDAFGPGGANDPAPANPYRAGLINLRFPLSAFISSRTAGEIIAWAIGLVLAAPALVAMAGRPTGAAFMHSFSVLILVQMLVLFHRNYDAVVVVFPFAWALCAEAPWTHRWPVLLTVGLFFLPSGAALAAAAKLHYVPEWVASSTIWQTIILPYQAWALLIMASWMSYCLVRPENGVAAAVSGNRQRHPIATGRVHQ
jgi:hypothetical protein